MPKLFQVKPEGEVAVVAEVPFVDEVSDMESFIKSNAGLLGEKVNIFGEQVDTGLGRRIDLLAMDQSLDQGKLLLIELKNTPADTDVLVQVLKYASWIMSSPDSIRYLLQKASMDTEGADLKPRIVILAPEFEEELIELTRYISTFEFSFLQLKRFQLGTDVLAVVEDKAPPLLRGSSVRAQEEWSWERYERDLGVSRDQVELGQWLVKKVEETCEKKGWQLQFRFRKGYTPFQLPGAWNVIGTQNRWAKGWCIWFKLPAPPGDLGMAVPAWAQQTYWDPTYHIIYINVSSSEVDLTLLAPFFEQAYAYVSKLSGATG
ncbi:MAG: hypothetical protein HY685_03785 [Chloroflexi bacterium]|nr:hypothetical protein [Chloroflexota bacterium]